MRNLMRAALVSGALLTTCSGQALAATVIRSNDIDPPDTFITLAPTNTIGKNMVKFRFEADEPNSTFECKLDRRPYQPCTSPRRFSVGDGMHTFMVRAIDSSGNADPTPERYKFKVVE